MASPLRTELVSLVRGFTHNKEFYGTRSNEVIGIALYFERITEHYV